MLAFTIVCGVATLLSFLLQLSSSLPAKYKKYLTHAMMLFLGATIGLLFNFVSAVHVSMPETVTVVQIRNLLISCGTGLLIAILLLMSVLVENDKQRYAAQTAASGASFFFVVYLMFSSL